ncbi:hypothetical protein SAMN04487772_105169 [[Clostridium] polysaccharolyticum]|uniref:Uncharacterized protein n=1 Tax=[Clostridium] polysaccharolyticum TaxID=29364 RepID=A0A1I0AIY8_9FIRM|nr:hypothetical protein SAMN04487772_105169 [[Clostridium] polysaccharolyticum]
MSVFLYYNRNNVREVT